MEVTWEDGKLSGDATAIALTNGTVKGLKRRGDIITFPYPRPFGTAFNKDFLTNPLAARILLQRYVFDEVLEMSGEVPEPPERKFDHSEIEKDFGPGEIFY